MSPATSDGSAAPAMTLGEGAASTLFGLTRSSIGVWVQFLVGQQADSGDVRDGRETVFVIGAVQSGKPPEPMNSRCNAVWLRAEYRKNPVMFCHPSVHRN